MQDDEIYDKYIAKVTYTPSLQNITDIHTIKIGDSKIKIVADTSVPRDEIWFVDYDGRTQKMRMR